jgi:uncharacterized protein YwqG
MNDVLVVRSFILNDQFWDISWTRLYVEVGSGKVGKSDRVKEHYFESKAAMDAFIASQIAKVLKKGFIQCDPASIKAPDVNEADPFAKRVDTLSKKLRRTTFVPVISDSDDDGTTKSKFGGRPWLTCSPDWPLCGRCEKPMNFVLQFKRDDMPAEWQPIFLKAMIQFFWCDSECQAEDGFEPFAKSTLIRHVALPLTSNLEAREVECYPEKILQSWEPRADYPSYEDIIAAKEEDEDAIEISEAFEARGDIPVRGEKLGGWSDWIQTPQYPRCTCSAKMQPFFQIDSNCTLPIQFGDLGVGWMMVCDKCKTMTFLWQCH